MGLPMLIDAAEWGYGFTFWGPYVHVFVPAYVFTYDPTLKNNAQKKFQNIYKILFWKLSLQGETAKWSSLTSTTMN